MSWPRTLLWTPPFTTSFWLVGATWNLGAIVPSEHWSLDWGRVVVSWRLAFPNISYSRRNEDQMVGAMQWTESVTHVQWLQRVILSQRTSLRNPQNCYNACQIFVSASTPWRTSSDEIKSRQQSGSSQGHEQSSGVASGVAPGSCFLFHLTASFEAVFPPLSLSWVPRTFS